jgi:hypothetical protein
MVVQMKRSMFDLEQVNELEAEATVAAESTTMNAKPIDSKCFDRDDDDKVYVADSHEGLSELELWHRRLCHCSEKYLRKSLPKLKRKFKGASLGWCDACVEGGIQRRPFNKSSGSNSNRGDQYVLRNLADIGNEDAATKEEPKAKDADAVNVKEQVTDCKQRLDKVMADTCQPYSNCLSTSGNKYFFL